jgi:DnaJ-class molecular chaperone
MDANKAVFTTHIDNIGRLKDGKERHECPHCNGECFIKNQSVSPTGAQAFTFECTDCSETWDETY